MDIVVSGSTGLIGSALVTTLERGGHRVRRLVRRAPSGPSEVRWDSAAGTIDTEALAGVQAAVHLAGESVAGRWTDDKKRAILSSRVDGTRLLAETLAGLDPRPSVFLSGSAVGVYGDRGDEELTEASSHGTGFLADVCIAWEAATAAAQDAGIRTVNLRTGVVLTPEGGALKTQLPIFRLGLGGRLGSGRQWFPWISLVDEVGAIAHLLTADVEGPVNLGSPNPVTNADFTRALGRALGRPTFLPVPKFGPAVLFGREATEGFVMSSNRMLPPVLESTGYEFTHPTVEPALADMLGKKVA